MAEPAWREKLLRAIDCILNQKGVRAIPLVVINGLRFDPALRKRLEHRADIKTFYLADANIPEAQAYGVEQVLTPFFSFLDDDDLFLDGALAHRLELMSASPSPDVVVTNLYSEHDGRRELAAPDLGVYAADPAHSILEFAWLHSANCCFRRATVGPDDFRANLPHMEWTSLAIRLTRDRRIAFSNRPTAIYFDTPGSASKQDTHMQAQAILMASLRNQPLSRRTRRLVDRKYVGALHALAMLALRRGEAMQAWRYHLQCLVAPTGWRYLSYTRKLLEREFIS